MKNILILIIFCCYSNFHTQNKSFAEYEIKVNRNGINLTSVGKLYTNDTESVSLFTLSQYKNLIDKYSKISNESNTTFMDGRKVCIDDYYYMIDLDKKSAYYELYDYSCDTKTAIQEEIRLPQWNIDRKIFNYKNYKVKKATAVINDRTWTVYFSPELKTNINPWRFNGLPGMVVYAEDSNKIFSFNLISLEQNKNKNLTFIENKNLKKLNFDEYKDFVINEYWKYTKLEIQKISTAAFDKNEYPKYETLEFIEKR
ncbi:GLPGLI family protein [Chryseobacterium sp. H1D6B]|uniref:GLPGLI family protein n=1 Tax=Chryseobacterium sp. H1D6B TaxID=2940588 RepID=UPI0015C8799B|nr:GLPGLI family protein [Chryseobacterium sp. H1D6B]MDH6252207.1 GLPGLI family protein [Chryseobacterium sp. H1D6B]